MDVCKQKYSKKRTTASKHLLLNVIHKFPSSTTACRLDSLTFPSITLWKESSCLQCIQCDFKTDIIDNTNDIKQLLLRLLFIHVLIKSSANKATDKQRNMFKMSAKTRKTSNRKWRIVAGPRMIGQIKTFTAKINKIKY